MKNTQRGIGLTEVLVSLVILGIAILGFTAMQIRAVAASGEATQNVLATNLARDLSERMRMNRAGFDSYQEVSTVVNCENTFCDPNKIAEFDFLEVKEKATALGMKIAILDCQGATLTRQCIYVSWAKTTPTNGTADTDCTNGTSYTPDAQCIIMETYNYE